MGKNDLGVVVLGLGLVYFLSRKKDTWGEQDLLENLRLTDPSYQLNGVNGDDDDAEPEDSEVTTIAKAKTPKRHRKGAIPIVTRRIPIVSHIAEKPVKRIRGVYEIR